MVDLLRWQGDKIIPVQFYELVSPRIFNGTMSRATDLLKRENHGEVLFSW
jgi:hypothetical protein